MPLCKDSAPRLLNRDNQLIYMILNKISLQPSLCNFLCQPPARSSIGTGVHDHLMAAQPDQQAKSGFRPRGIVVSLPGNRDTLQRSRDLKHQHAAIGVFQLMDFTEGDARFRIFRNLHLQRMQAFGLQTVVRADHATGFVVHAEHQPVAIASAQVGFVC